MAAGSGYKSLQEIVFIFIATPIMNKNVKFKAIYAKYIECGVSLFHKQQINHAIGSYIVYT